ncbi:FISUMP domain-containing protein [Bacteroidota bacterium]
MSTNQSITLPGDATLILTQNTGIPSISDLSQRDIIYPNPFSGSFFLITSVQQAQNIYLSIQNMRGQVIARYNQEVQQGIHEFELSIRQAGIYAVSLTSLQGTNSYQVISTGLPMFRNGIQYNGTPQNVDNNLIQRGQKSLSSNYSLGYHINDIVHFRCWSGSFSTVFTDSPTLPRNYDVEFVACTDLDGIDYPVIHLGDQTWMEKNLAYLPSVSPPTVSSDFEEHFYVTGYYTDNMSVSAAKQTDNYDIYGVLYNWPAAMSSCPEGWHLPSDEEWSELSIYLIDNGYGFDGGGDDIGKSMASRSEWRESEIFGVGAVSNELSSNNSSGFNAYPGGFYYDDEWWLNRDISANFWSSTEDGKHILTKDLIWGGSGVYSGIFGHDYGGSVRCLKGSVPPVVVTLALTEMFGTTAKGGGKINPNGISDIPSRGVCWSTTENPTIINSHTTDGEGIGTYSSNLTGLTINTTYYVRAYAYYRGEPIYGEQISFTAWDVSSCGEFVDDRDGTIYPTIQIGEQCWMAKNLAYLPIPPYWGESSEDPHYYLFDYFGISVDKAKETDNYQTYGVMYNWPASMASCPEGWHLPGNEEWSELSDYLINNGYGFEGSGEDIGKSLASPFGWAESEIPGQVGHNPVTNNRSGFNALPGGSHGFYEPNLNLSKAVAFKMDPENYDMSRFAAFWSSSMDGSLAADGYYLMYFRGNLSHTTMPRDIGAYVRCLKGVVKPTVETASISEIDLTTAISGGKVVSDGGDPVTTRGVCWSTSEEPTIDEDSYTTDGTGTGSFTSNLTGLSENSNYYVRAYATNSEGTDYGEEVNFIALATFVDDRDGHVYKKIDIGTQTWMAENLAYLPSVSSSSEGSDSEPYYYVYNYEGSDVSDAKSTGNYLNYGALYNWSAAMSACPDGWNLPSDEEWKVLEQYLGMTETDANNTGQRLSGDVGMKLKSTTGWNDNGNGDNSSEFNALPGGVRLHDGGGFSNLNVYAYFWSSTEYDYLSYFRYLFNESDGAGRAYFVRETGYSVRCIKGAKKPSVTTLEVYDILPNTATGGGIVLSDGGAPVTARGVCWSTSEEPTIDEDSYTTDGTGTGSFTSNLTGLSESSNYYVRAYATNSEGTDYGEEVNFIALATFVDDRDGHVYKKIDFGTQTWMAENLAYLPSVSPSYVGSDTDPYYYVYDYQMNSISAAKATDNYKDYGVLYNWEAARTACPGGWHLPSDEEWKILEKYLGMSSSDADDIQDRYSGNVGRKLKSTSGWYNDGNGNNSSGFNALPGGNRQNERNFVASSFFANFWSSSEIYDKPWRRYLDSTSDGINRYFDYPSNGYSVRCLKD